MHAAIQIKFICSIFQQLIHCLLSGANAVLGSVESRGVLRKISDMLEVILKRMDRLSQLDNTSTTEARRLDELSSAINRCGLPHYLILTLAHLAGSQQLYEVITTPSM